MTRWLTLLLGIAWFGLCPWTSTAAEPPRVLELRTQEVDGITYFHVRLERPADLGMPAFDTGKPFSDADRRKFARLPRLVPQDGKTRAVFYRHRPTQPGLSFCGQVTGGGRARFLLLYPLPETTVPKDLPLAELVRSPGTGEAVVEMDFGKARVVPAPKTDADDQYIHRDDLRSLWALHQGSHLAVLETQVLDFNFYSFAREATGRKYGVMAPAWVKRQTDDPEHRLYEITTGADALAETLQLHRLLQPEGKSDKPPAERSVDLSAVKGVTVPEQPWGRLLGGARPEVEPLARLVPHDNYYVHFKSIRKFLEFGDLLDLWGTSVLRVYEMKSRDCRLRERYERQLCLKSTALGKLLGPAVVKSVAVTGSDPFVREGTDVAILFQVANRRLFLAALEEFLDETRKEHGDRLREGRDDYHGTTIEKFVTPLREVSLHRAVVGDFVIYANSAVSIRRILDARREGGRLADAEDFRYLRTLFPVGDEAEDGLVYLSDAFLRQLTGPASRIKERRRVEALTSLYMTTNAALFCAWETGKLPATHEAALKGAGLRPEDVAVPEGKGVRWDADRKLAVSDVYNTLHFATPLIELPIDRVTPAEAKAYGDFREEYEKLWRTYYDPIGLRFSFDDRRVRVETHILPLAASEQYRSLRTMTGPGKSRFQPRAEAVVDFRLSVGEDLTFGLQLDGNEVLRRMVEVLIRWEAAPGTNLRQEYDRLFWKLPLAVGVQGKAERDRIETEVENLVGMIRNALGEEPEVRKHKGVAIHRVPISGEKYRQVIGFLDPLSKQAEMQALTTLLALLPRQEAPLALHVAGFGEGIVVSADESYLKKRIDQAEERKKPGPGKAPEPGREANASLFLSPANARAAAGLFLEYEGHSLALLNNPVWNCFYQTGLLAPDAADSVRERTARHYLGFVPVSPDGSPYRFDARHGEVVSERHGSQSRPDLHDQVAPTSELGKFLDQVRSLRAELRFLENGLHTVLTIERRPAP